MKIAGNIAIINDLWYNKKKITQKGVIKMSDLNAQQIKEYLKNVFDLEGALYQHQQLVDGYTTRRRNNTPTEPVKHLPSPPSKPIPRLATAPQNNKMTPKMLGLIVVFAITFFFGFSFLLFPLAMAAEGYDGLGSYLVWGIILTPISIYCLYLMRQEKKSQEAEIEAENQADYQRYERAMDAHRIAVANAEKEHSNKMQVYAQRRAEYNRETNAQLQKFDEVKATLQTSLTKLYSQNIVYAKYRNLVAIATIYEYFDSGRCTELEGPNGAYNMYEGELRSNIIICSLSQIISDLGQIKNGQYALYEQIRRSNENVTHLLNNIYNAQMLTAYYAEAAAIAASADRITYGVLF